MANLALLLKKLLESKIDFVLVGGYAAVVHGASQVTQDLDICATFSEDGELKKLKEALRDLSPKHRMNPSFQPSLDDYPEDGKFLDNYYLKTNAGVLDIIKEVPPVGSFKEIKSRAIKAQIFGYQCYIISIDDLIAVKSSMNRPKDKSVLAELLEIKKLKLSQGR